MRILLISYDNWGYNKHIIEAFNQLGYEVSHINFYKYLYKYPNFLYRIFNFFTKILFNYNIKREYYNKKISADLNKLPQQDLIILIKADFLSKKTLLKAKEKSNKIILFINDNIERYPRTKKIISIFDEIYSFEKKDCKKYNLKFKSNFIYYKEELPINKLYKYKIFNISSYDYRFPILEKISKKINTLNKIIICSDKNIKSKYTEISKHSYSLEEVKNLIDDSEIILDVNRSNQFGLSFRVFESLGLNKKLITTNQDIINYDFYNKNNIFVISDLENISIDENFLNTKYQPITNDILDKYYIKNWIKEFLT